MMAGFLWYAQPDALWDVRRKSATSEAREWTKAAAVYRDPWKFKPGC